MNTPISSLSTFLKNEFGLPPHLIEKVTPFYSLKEIPKNAYIVKEGAYCHNMALITEGYFRFYGHNDKKSITHWIFGKNQFITDVASFFLREKAKWNIQALTDAKVYSLTYSNYQKLRTETSEWDHFEKLLLVKLMSALENRVYALVSMSAEQRYQYLLDSDPKMFNGLPLQYIASMLGMSPETLSRIRAKSIS